MCILGSSFIEKELLNLPFLWCGKLVFGTIPKTWEWAHFFRCQDCTLGIIHRGGFEKSWDSVHRAISGDNCSSVTCGNQRLAMC